jgi:hypothetical protein
VKPFDWKKFVKKLAPKMKEVEFEGKHYYSAQSDFPMIGPGPLYFYLPDDRTLVVDTEENLRKFIKGDGPAKEKLAWSDDWKRVEWKLFACVLDNAGNRWGKELAKRSEKSDAAVVKLFETCGYFVDGLDDADSVVLEGFIGCTKDEAAKETVKAIEEVLASTQKQIADVVKTESKKENLAWEELVLGRMKQTAVTRAGKEVRVKTEVKKKVADLIDMLLAVERE